MSLSLPSRFAPLFQRLPLLGKLRGVQPLAWLLAVSAVLFFIQVADEMAEGDTLRIDRLLILALRQPGRLDTPIGPLWLQQAAIDISGLGGFTVLTLLSAAAVGFLMALRRWREAGCWPPPGRARPSPIAG